MAKYLDDRATQQKCEDAVQKLLHHIPDPNGSKQAAALMALAGISPADEINASLLAKNGVQGVSTFMGYYVLQSRALAGDYQGALDNIRNYWGAMLDLGATTFWENFYIEDAVNAARIDEIVPEGKVDIHGYTGEHCYIGYRHSLCHGWSAGPAPWLSEHVLGIKILEPGCKRLKIAPHLGDLKWVEGTFPTPFGIVKVKHKRRKNGDVRTTYKARKEIIVES